MAIAWAAGMTAATIMGKIRDIQRKELMQR
jgi:hypothetical protein